MACGSTKTIYEINDLYGMFKIMKALNISSKGLKPLEELKTQVITALNLLISLKLSQSGPQVR